MFKLPAYDAAAIAMLGFGILAALSLAFVFSYLQLDLVVRYAFVHQNAQQQRRMIGSRTRTAIAPNHRRQVKTVDHLYNKPRQVFLRKPFIH